MTNAFFAGATAFAYSRIEGHFRAESAANQFKGVEGTLSFGGNELTKSQVAQQITAHALVGGVTATMQGRKFGHGFFTAGVTKGLGGKFLPAGDNLSATQIVGGTFGSAIIGGTASVISGGKFSNGARSGSFQFLFNQINQEAIESLRKLHIKKDQIENFSGVLDLLNKMGSNIQGARDLEEMLNALSIEELQILARNPALGDKHGHLNVLQNLDHDKTLLIEGLMYYDNIDRFRAQLGYTSEAIQMAQSNIYIAPLVNGTPQWFQDMYTMYSYYDKYRN